MSKDSVQKKDYKSTSTKSENEDDPEIAHRIYAILSYFFVLIILGIPIWWYTTRVYRAPLPLTQMYEVNLKNRSDKQYGIPLSLEYDVLVSFVHPNPMELKIELDGRDIEENLRPFLSKMNPVADLIVKSQWLYLTELGAIPRKIDNRYVLLENQLPHIITPLETKIFSHMSSRPSLNLVIYFSHCNSPLYIYNNNNEIVESNAFFSPRWGGILIYNSDKESCESHSLKPDMKKITQTFATTLQSLFKMNGVSDKDIEALKQKRIEEMLDSTRRTLKSLAQLLSEINSIVISDEVADKINLSVEKADEVEIFLEKGQVDKALKSAKIAFKNSEEAFSHPSLLALLYFPDDQKYAIYIPLFLPVMIPVVMSLTSIWNKAYKMFGEKSTVSAKKDL